MSERERVQAAFHRGACLYDQYTPVQQRVVERLLELIRKEHDQFRTVLDIGCGTGRLLASVNKDYPGLKLTGIDLAFQMLRQAADRLPADAQLVQGDAEQLPFADHYFDLVLSSSTFQWLASLEGSFRQIFRVLQPDGRFLISLFGAGTLYELQNSWRMALEQEGSQRDITQDGTHRFHTKEQVLQALQSAGFTDCKVWEEQEVAWYPDVAHLLQAIKRIGAGTARPPAGGGLGWRKIIHGMADCYTEQYGSTRGVPATYSVIYAAGRR